MPPATTPTTPTATVRWVDPLDGERVEFAVIYSPDRARDPAVTKLFASDLPKTDFGSLLDILAGRPGAPESALVTSWDVEGAELTRETLEGLPQGLLRAILAAVVADVVAGRRRSIVFRRGTYQRDARALSQQGRIDEGIALARAATRAYPRIAGPWFDLGTFLFKAGRDAEADAAFTRALRIGGDALDRDEAYRWRGFSRLRRGDLAAGFADHAVTELVVPGVRTWRGEHRPDAAVLVTDGARLGHGDSLQCVRYLPMVRERVGRVILACRPPLVRLYELSGVADAIVDSTTFDRDPTWDAWLQEPGHFAAGTGFLPCLFTTSFETIPPPVTLTPPPLADRLAGLLHPDDGLRVGLVWANGHFGTYERRSMDLEQLAPLGRVDGATFFALQVGPRSEQALTPPAGLPLVNAGPLLADFADTAALIRRLDLVVTVDTAAAHLAGSLDIPTWILLPLVADWRWFLDRDDSPWYPSARLFRQQRAGEWGPVVERVAAELAAFIATRGDGRCPTR